MGKRLKDNNAYLQNSIAIMTKKYLQSCGCDIVQPSQAFHVNDWDFPTKAMMLLASAHDDVPYLIVIPISPING